MSSKKTITKVAAKKAATKKATRKSPSKEAAATTPPKAAAKKAGPAKKTSPKKVPKADSAKPLNITPIPGKLSRTAMQFVSAAEEHLLPLIKKHGTKGLRMGLIAAAEHVKSPGWKKALRIAKDFIPE